MASIREVLGDPPIKDVVYSHEKEVIRSIDVEVDGIRFRALRVRAATSEELARLDTDAAHTYRTEYKTVEV